MTQKEDKHVQLPNGDKISSTQEGDLKLSSQLPSTKATVLPHLTTSSLISLGKLCDEGCNISLNKETMQVKKDGNMVLQGYRNHNDGLWDIPIYNHPNPKTSIQPDNYILPPSHNIYKYDTINLMKSDRPTKTFKAVLFLDLNFFIFLKPNIPQIRFFYTVI